MFLVVFKMADKMANKRIETEWEWNTYFQSKYFILTHFRHLRPFKSVKAFRQVRGVTKSRTKHKYCKPLYDINRVRLRVFIFLIIIWRSQPILILLVCQYASHTWALLRPLNLFFIFQQFFSVTFLVLFPCRAMKTSVDSLKLAVSWKESQVQGAKFTVKVCSYTSVSQGGWGEGTGRVGWGGEGRGPEVFIHLVYIKLIWLCTRGTIRDCCSHRLTSLGWKRKPSTF